jgi:hypothetical protein
MSRHHFWTSVAASHFPRGAGSQRGLDEGVTDVFFHSIPDRHLKDAKLEAFPQVLLKWSAKAREHTFTALAATA